MHFVQKMPDGIYRCDCKSFWHSVECAHVSVAMHLDGHINVDRELDDVDDEDGGELSEEVDFTQLLEGVRLLKEYRRVNDAQPPTNSPGAVVEAVPKRVKCKCKKSNGDFCLAKQQRAGPTAKKYPDKMFWACSKARTNVSSNKHVYSSNIN